MANTRVLNSSRTVTQKPSALSSSQTSSTGGSFSSSASAGVPPSAAGARTVRQCSYAQSYLTAATANQTNNNPVMRPAPSRSAAGQSVYASVAVSTDSVATSAVRARMQPSGMHLALFAFVCFVMAQ